MRMMMLCEHGRKYGAVCCFPYGLPSSGKAGIGVIQDMHRVGGGPTEY